MSASSSSDSAATPALRWKRPHFAALIIFAAVMGVYWNSLRSPFLFDDLGAVELNSTIRKLSTAFTPPPDGSTTTGRPVLNFSFAINYAFGGLDAWGYHFGNTLIHASTALVLFGLIRRTLQSPALANSFAKSAEPIAFWSALIWAVHPLQTESVTCIAQRTESLCGIFYLLTFYGFARSRDSATPIRWLGLSVASCLIGMATKEVTATAPLLVLLYDRTFFGRTFATAWQERRRYYAAIAATWLMLLSLVVASGGTRGASAGFSLGISSWEYLFKQCEALVLYLKLSLWPHPLVLDYGTAFVSSPLEVWWQGLVVLGLLSATVWALIRVPVGGFIGAWFFVILAPSSSFVPLVTQTMAEHRMYLPLISIIILFTIAVWRAFAGKSVFIFGAAAALLATFTVKRNHDYSTALVIWADTVEKCPASARARVNLGLELSKAGERDAALEQFAQAIKLNTVFAVSGHYHSGTTYLEMGDTAKAIEHLQAAVKIAPTHDDARFALANALVQAGRATEALPHYAEVLKHKPAADAHSNLGVALVRLGRTSEAIPEFKSALELDSTLASTHYHLAKALTQTGQITEAFAHYADAVRLSPDQAEMRNDYGVLLARTGHVTEAERQLRNAIRLKPDYAEAYANLGNVFLIQNKTRDAIAQYEHALQLKPNDMRTQQNLQISREALDR